MANIKVSGLDTIPMVYASRVTKLREEFNDKLWSLGRDWTKTSGNTFVPKGGEEAFKSIMTIVPLKRLSGGSRGTQRAQIILEVKEASLTDFFVEQQRVSKAGTYNEASMKRGKYKEKKAGLLTPDTEIFTKAKLLKQGKTKLVQVNDTKKGTLSSARGLKGFMYSPRNRVTASASTPEGVYVRLQAETWKKGKRLPTYKLNAPPLAIIMLSPRILKRISFQKRLNNLL